jgi:hypothetical protein
VNREDNSSGLISLYIFSILFSPFYTRPVRGLSTFDVISRCTLTKQRAVKVTFFIEGGSVDLETAVSRSEALKKPAVTR